MEPMALFATTHGTIRMPLWSADNWDSPPMVSYTADQSHLCRMSVC